MVGSTAMTTLERLIIDHVLLVEGGLVNHPSDPGGVTNYGPPDAPTVLRGQYAWRARNDKLDIRKEVKDAQD